MKNKILKWIDEQEKMIYDPYNEGYIEEDYEPHDEGEETNRILLSELREFIGPLCTKEEILKEFFIEVSASDEGISIVNGKWYVPKFGCDTLEKVLDNLYE